MGESAKYKRMDIQQWMDLAKTNPDEFERKRSEVIERMIETAAESRRLQLRRVQWRIDRIRERSTTPLAAAITISGMMWESFYKLNERYLELAGNFAGSPKACRVAPGCSASSRRCATILPFRRPAGV